MVVRPERKSSMHVAVGRVRLELPGCHGLKEKRKVIRPLVARIRDRFGISAAEVGLQDVWHSSVIGLAVVGSSPAELDGVLGDAMRFVERNLDGRIVDTGVEIIGLGELHGPDAPDPGDEPELAGLEASWLEDER